MEDLIKFVQGLVPDSIKPFLNALLAGTAVLLAISKLVEPLASMRRGRREALAAQRRLDEATKSTAFWETWFKAHQLVSSENEMQGARDRVRAELQLILQTLEEPLVPSRIGRRRFTGRGFLRRAFLLYRPSGFAGWLFHVGFYFLLAGFFFYILGISIDPASAEMSWQYFLTHLGDNLAPGLIILIPLVWLNVVASRRDPQRSAAVEETGRTNP